MPRRLPVAFGGALVGVTFIVSASAVRADPGDAEDLVARAHAAEDVLRESVGPIADAKDFFARGRELRLRDDCVDALPFFQKSYTLYPAGLGSLRNIAECSESLGQFASARQAWLDLRQAVSTRTDPKYEGWAEDATEAAARLASNVARITIDLDAKTPAGHVAKRDGLEVTLNGEPVPANLIATAIVRDAGHYLVRVDGKGVAIPQEAALNVVGGSSTRVLLSVVVGPGGSAKGARGGGDHGASVGEDSGAGDARRNGIWLALGLGSVGLLGASVSFIVRQVALGDLQNECPQYASMPCPLAAQSAIDREHTANVLIDVFGAVGAVGVTTGLVLLATDKRTATTAITMTPSGLWAHGTF